jgi:putative ABC transport system permease protein
MMIRQDIRFALRQAIRQPAFTLLALLTFALTIGANTAVFSVVERVILRPLPFDHPATLAAIWPTRTISNGELEFMQRNAKSFRAVAAFSPGWGIALTGAGEPRQLDAARVSANFFQTLGALPIVGRAFHSDESEPGKWDVAIISHALWLEQFGGDPNVVQRVVDMDGTPHRIIGVMPADFEIFQSGVDAWLPLQIDRSSPFYTGQTARAFGRLAPGITSAAATIELATLAPRMRDAFNYTADYARHANVMGLQESIVGDSRPTLFVLFGAVSLLALIGVSNVGNLLLVHAAGRTRELAVRRALGATRPQLIRQLLVQSSMLAVAGGILGVGVGAVALRGLKAVLPATLPMLATAAIDTRVLVCCALVTMFAGLAFGIAPALFATRLDPDGVLRASGAAHGGRSAATTRTIVVVAEMALAMMLVVGATLMIESMWRLGRVDLGFEPANVLTFRIQPSSGQVRSPEQIRAYFDEMTRRIAAVPGVKSVGAVQHLPMSGFNWSGDVDVESHPIPSTAAHPRAVWRSVVGDYFATLRIPIIRGRNFTNSDTRDAPSVIIINETMARRFWPSADPLGKRVQIGSGTRKDWATVIGVVGDVRFVSPDVPADAEAYRPNSQQALVFMHYVARTAGAPLGTVADVRRAIRSLDTTVPIAEVRALDDLSSQATATRRTVAQLLAVFAALGLSLAAVGIYGVISYGVAQRTQELGVRAALGAQQHRIVLMVLSDGARMAVAGIVVGAGVALLASRTLEPLVYGVATRDPLLYGGVALALTIVAALACVIPARRASRVDPLVALRGD